MQFSAEPVGGQAAVDDLVPAPRRGQDIADTLFGARRPLDRMRWLPLGP